MTIRGAEFVSPEANGSNGGDPAKMHEDKQFGKKRCSPFVGFQKNICDQKA